MKTKRLFLILLLCGNLIHCSKKEVDTSTSLPPKGKAIHDFQLVNQGGKEVSLKDFEGDVWIVSFVFTTCPSICPKVTKTVATLQSSLEEKKLPAKLVTLTVDPEVDTPDVLQKYGEKYSADFKRWSFLTATSVDSMREVVEGNFKTAMGEKKALQAGMYDIAHTTKLVLVDQAGYHRGYYSTDSAGIGHLLEAVQALTENN